MYDRYDASKGRYVTYDYQPKGDRFSRGLSELPRVWSTVTHHETGRRFVRRVRTTDAQSLTVAQIKAQLPPKMAAKLEQLTLYFHYGSDRLTISKNPLGFPVRFDVTQQAKGRRLWFVCVGCWRRAGKLYTVKTNEGVIWGCQRCLGLSYLSQAQHKTRARDMVITTGDIRVGVSEELRAHHRQRRRLMRLSASADKFFKKRL